MRTWINISALLAVALLAALCTLWLRSYHVADAVSWQRWHNVGGTYHGHFGDVYSGRGVFRIDFLRLTTAFPSSTSTARQWEWTRSDATHFRLPRDTFWQRLGFGYISDSQSAAGLRNATVTTRAYWVPYWALVTLASIVPLRWLLVALTRARRRRRGLCARCGYDVRFSEGRCPECGAPLPAASKRSTSSGASAR